LARSRLDARDVTADLPDPRGVFKLTRSLLEAQVELLFLQLHQLILELVEGLVRVIWPSCLSSPGYCLIRRCAERSGVLIGSLAAARRMLHAQRLRGTPSISNMIRPGFTGSPVFDRALTLTHADFGRLLGNRQIREDADPHTAGTLHVTGHGTAGGLDLARGNALRLQAFRP
jgi:hypothetical protein